MPGQMPFYLDLSSLDLVSGYTNGSSVFLPGHLSLPPSSVDLLLVLESVQEHLFHLCSTQILLFLKSRVVNLLPTLLVASEIFNSTILWSLQPKLPVSFTFPTSPSLLVKHSTVHCWLLNQLVKDICCKCTQEPSGLFVLRGTAPQQIVGW